MTTGTGVKWELEADYLQGCSCDYGCPCEFEAPPTRGWCEGMGAYRINSGRYGDVRLDGLGLAFVGRCPGPMHLGNGNAVFLIDERANESQREALRQIVTGQAGGMPFEIFPPLFPKQEVRYATFQFDIAGETSSIRIGNLVDLAVEPIKNPVTGEPESIQINHGTGFIFKEAQIVSAKECRSALGGELGFSWPDEAGFVARVKYGN